MIKFQQQFYAMLCKSRALPGETSKLKILNKSNPSVHNKNRAAVAALFSEKVRLCVARPGRHQARAVGQPGHPGHPGHRTNQHTSDQHREELHQSLRNDRRDLQRMKGFPEVHVFLLCKDCFSRHIIL